MRKNNGYGLGCVFMGRVLTIKLKSFTQTVLAARLKSKDSY